MESEINFSPTAKDYDFILAEIVYLASKYGTFFWFHITFTLFQVLQKDLYQLGYSLLCFQIP